MVSVRAAVRVRTARVTNRRIAGLVGLVAMLQFFLNMLALLVSQRFMVTAWALATAVAFWASILSEIYKARSVR